MATMDIHAENEILRSLTVGGLHERYRQVFCEEPRSRNKDFLVKRILWRMQACREGDLSERARRRAEELAGQATLRLTPPKDFWLKSAGSQPENAFRKRCPASLLPGMKLTREYQGNMVAVEVRENGFEYDGQIYRSLSAIARQVTGTRWNGHLFFGLRGQTEKTGGEA